MFKQLVEIIALLRVPRKTVLSSAGKTGFFNLLYAMLSLKVSGILEVYRVVTNSRKMVWNVRLAFGTIFENLWKSSQKWSEIFGKSLKTPSSVCLENTKNITR